MNSDILETDVLNPLDDDDKQDLIDIIVKYSPKRLSDDFLKSNPDWGDSQRSIFERNGTELQVNRDFTCNHNCNYPKNSDVCKSHANDYYYSKSAISWIEKNDWKTVIYQFYGDRNYKVAEWLVRKTNLYAYGTHCSRGAGYSKLGAFTEKDVEEYKTKINIL
jgi:hypothetical protein